MAEVEFNIARDFSIITANVRLPSKYQGLRKDIIRFEPEGQRGGGD